MTCNSSGIRRLILASGSPRRRQLLSLLGLPFVVKATGVEETPLAGEPPTEMVLRISQAKAFAVNGARPEDLVIAADTTVVMDGQVLSKPTDPNDAVRMLRLLRGRPHTVYSAVSVWHPAGRRMRCGLAGSTVWMRDYGDDEIAAYVNSGDPLDKAGAYAIQHPEFDPVARVEGCRMTVVGFPLCHLRRALATFGVVVPAHVPRACQAFSQQGCSLFSAILEGGQVGEGGGHGV